MAIRDPGISASEFNMLVDQIGEDDATTKRINLRPYVYLHTTSGSDNFVPELPTLDEISDFLPEEGTSEAELDRVFKDLYLHRQPEFQVLVNRVGYYDPETRKVFPLNYSYPTLHEIQEAMRVRQISLAVLKKKFGRRIVGRGYRFYLAILEVGRLRADGKFRAGY